MKLFFLSLIILVGCTKKAAEPDLVEKGRMVYVANCTSCHGVDPKLQGNLGPAIHGSSFELLEKRVIDGRYPENYKPKRETKIMQALPFLKNDIQALHAYLNKP